VVRETGRAGVQPWQRAVDRYGDWLRTKLSAAGIQPSVPGWIQMAHGWLNVQLENARRWEPARLEALWRRWGGRLPWLQFWGQMSDYGGGCCLDEPEMHPRYKPDLPRLARMVARTGHVGFYARPSRSHPSLVDDTGVDPSAAFGVLRAWLDRNRRDYGANAFYVDELGGRDFGPALAVAQLIEERIGMDTVVERAMDVYPAAFLASGALSGGTWQGGPERTLPVLGPGLTRTTFPSFGRYLLRDRVMFLGESNGDGRWWGPSADYWTERQAFLLGAKFDVIHPAEAGEMDGAPNRALEVAIAQRDRVDWWSREPRYLDRIGLDEIPPDVDVRRFRGKEGENLLAVDNWGQRRDVRITMDGRAVSLPSDALSVVVLPASSPERAAAPLVGRPPFLSPSSAVSLARQVDTDA
jgi:hypothetical protein